MKRVKGRNTGGKEIKNGPFGGKQQLFPPFFLYNLSSPFLLTKKIIL